MGGVLHTGCVVTLSGYHGEGRSPRKFCPKAVLKRRLLGVSLKLLGPGESTRVVLSLLLLGQKDGVDVAPGFGQLQN